MDTHLLLTGGGTAGHIMPNLALIESLKSQNLKISYIGSNTGLESKLVPEFSASTYPVDFYSIQSGKLRRYFSWQNFTDIFRVITGFFQSFHLLHKLKPNLVFSKGGFVALPVVLAARILRIPIIIHESDSIPGLTTKITSRFATQIWSDSTTIPQAKKIQLPIRPFLFSGTKKQFSSTNPTLLVMGGSLGASVLNQFVSTNLTALLQNFNLIHICGKGNLTTSKADNYLQFEYVDQDLANLYASANFILSRSGASALAEFAALNKSVVLVPLPKTQSRGEQILNAQEFCKQYSGQLINQSELNLETFMKAIHNLKATSTKTIQVPAQDLAAKELLAFLFKNSPKIKNKV